MTGIRIRLSLALVTALVAALAFLSLRTAERAEALLAPELAAKAEAVARSVAGLVALAEGVGIPLDRLEGIGAHLDARLAANPDLAWIALVDAAGRPIAAAGQPSGTPGALVPVAPLGGSPGVAVAVDLDPAFARGVVFGLWIDLAVVIVVTALVAVELLYISFGAGLYGAIVGLDQRLRSILRGDLRQHPPVGDAAAAGQAGGAFLTVAGAIDARIARMSDRLVAAFGEVQRAGDAARRQTLEALQRRYRLGEGTGEASAQVIAVRAPLFVFMFAEELSRPFLPLLIERRAAGADWIDPALVIGLPMMVFLAIVALSQPVLGPLTERAGHRRSLLAGALLGAAGHAATAVAPDLLWLTAARAVTAVGFALVFVAAQGFVLGVATGGQRARGMAVFIGAILVAGLCGPPIGGILADRIGMEATFLLAAMLAAVSAGLAALALAPGGRGGGDAAPALRLRDVTAALAQPRLAALLVLCAFPAKAALVALCFFLTPLQLAALGQDQATTGRMLMIYPLAMVLLVPVFAGLADRPNRQAALVGLGGLVAGGGAMVMLVAPEGLAAHGAMLLLFGLGQAMSIAAQSALVGVLGRDVRRSPAGGEGVSETAVYGVFRLVERLGSAAGPLVAGVLLAAYGFGPAAAMIGAGVIAGALVFLGVMAAGGGTLRPPAPAQTGR